LVVLLVLVFNLALNLRTVLLVLGVVLLVGFIQEGMQLFSAVQVVSWNSVLDLGVDLIGAGIGLSVVWRIKKACASRNTTQV
jgi:hypothetical protein